MSKARNAKEGHVACWLAFWLPAICFLPYRRLLEGPNFSHSKDLDRLRAYYAQPLYEQLAITAGPSNGPGRAGPAAGPSEARIRLSVYAP